MALLVNQTQVPALTVPVNATTADANEVRGNDDTLRAKHNLHDADGTIHVQSSTLAARAAAGVVGRHWYTSDTAQFWYDNGTVWVAAAYAPTASPTFTGTVTLPAGIVWATIPYTAPVADAAGVLTSDGAGTLSFEAPAAGPSWCGRTRRGSVSAATTALMPFNIDGVDFGTDPTTNIPHSLTVNNTQFGSAATQGVVWHVSVSIRGTMLAVDTLVMVQGRYGANSIPVATPPSAYANAAGLVALNATFVVPQLTNNYFTLMLSNYEGVSRNFDYEITVTRLV